MTLTPNTFTGEYSYSLDSKGRVNIPARYRQVLSNDNENTFMTTRGQDTCVWVYPMIEWKKIESELRKLSSVSGTHRTFIRQISRSASLPHTINRDGLKLIRPSFLMLA